MTRNEKIKPVAGLSIEHLQLDPKINALAKKSGAVTIEQACELSDLADDVQKARFASKLTQALDQLAAASDGVNVDWQAYWISRGSKFYHPYMTCQEFSQFSAATPLFAVNRDGFGNAGRIYAKNGFHSFGALVDGLRKGITGIPGIGVKKYEELFDVLQSIALRLRNGEDVIAEYSALYPLDRVSAHDVANIEKNWKPYDLPQQVLNLPIGGIHLGNRGRALTSAGLKTVGDVVAKMPVGVSLIRNVGQEFLVKIDARLRNLEIASDAAGEVDWKAFCALCEIPYVGGQAYATGEEFLRSMNEIVHEIASNLSDPVAANLLTMRLNKAPQERHRLDQIGNSVSPSITRERVRQKETRLLTALRDAFTKGDFSDLEVHIAPEITEWWSLGYSAARQKAMDPGNLSEQLCRSWKVSPGLLALNYPFISTVMTGEIMTRIKLKETIAVDLCPLQSNPRTASVQLSKLMFPTSTRFLSSLAIETIGQLVEAIRDRRISRAISAKHGIVIDHLALLTTCLTGQGEIDWNAYIAASNCDVLPLRMPNTTAEFFLNIDDLVQEVLDAAPPTMRASLIFKKRTSRPMFTRMTMEQLAADLKSYAPGIKKEETELLAHLKAVILNDEWGRGKFGLDQRFVSAWRILAQQYEDSEGDIEEFIDQVAARWKVTSSHVEAALPTVIAVITGYPYGRLVRHSRTSAKSGELALATA